MYIPGLDMLTLQNNANLFPKFSYQIYDPTSNVYKWMLIHIFLTQDSHPFKGLVLSTCIILGNAVSIR